MTRHQPVPIHNHKNIHQGGRLTVSGALDGGMTVVESGSSEGGSSSPGSVTAADVTIADAAGNFTATNVEDALAELADDIAGASAPTGGHTHVAGETHLSDGSTTTYILDNYYEPETVIAWNTTSLARLTVTDVLPDQVTVSAAGSAGDRIVFDYAATLT